MTRLALPASSPEREMELAEREMNQAFDAWLATDSGTSLFYVMHQVYLEAVERYAGTEVSVTEARR